MTGAQVPLIPARRLVECLRADALALLGEQGDGTAQLIVTDPPYGISYQSNHRKAGKPAPIARDWNFQIGPLLDEVARVLVPGGAAFVFTRWDVYPLWARSVPPGLKLANRITWVKDNHSAGDLEGNFGFKTEDIMFLVKGRHRLRGRRWSNVWEFPRVPAARQIHPAEKPVPLLRRAIESSSDPGDLVIDPFCGSGATGEAAAECGRRALLGDTDPDVVHRARMRLGLPVDLAHKPLVRLVPDREPELCLDALDGLHPEDVAAMVEDWRRRREATP